MSKVCLATAIVVVMPLITLTSACFEAGLGASIRRSEGSALNDKFAPQWSHQDDRMFFAYDGSIYSVALQGGDLRKEQIPSVNDDPVLAESLQISPDGNRLLFSSFEATPCFVVCFNEDQNWRIVSTDIDGSNKMVLSKARNEQEWNGNAVWSPDGALIAFMSNRFAFESNEDDITPDHFSLFTMSSEGSNETNVTPGIRRATAHAPVWSPDGQHIAFTILGEEEERVLYVVRIQDSSLTKLGKIDAGPSWSPDGRLLAFARYVGDVTALYTVAPDGSSLMKIHERIHKSRMDEYSIKTVSWSPDGNRLLMSSTRTISLIHNDGSNFTVLLREYEGPYPSWGDYPSWSRDGSMIAAQEHPFLRGRSPGNDNIIVLMGSDGSEKRTLVKFIDEGDSDWRLETANDLWPEPEGTPRPLPFGEPISTPSARILTPVVKLSNDVSKHFLATDESAAKHDIKQICLNGSDGSCSPREAW